MVSKVYDCGDGIKFSRGGWEFDSTVASVFEEHAKKSIPGYSVMHEYAVKDIVSMYNMVGDKCLGVLDLGCSVGRLEELVKESLPYKGNLDIVMTGVDSSEYMLQNTKELDNRFDYIRDDIGNYLKFKIGASNIIVSLFTMQFIKPKDRFSIYSDILRHLDEDGIFILADKFEMDYRDDISRRYDMFKYYNGYSPMEIKGKKIALEGVQFPLSIVDLDTLRSVGFKNVEEKYNHNGFKYFVCSRREV